MEKCWPTVLWQDCFSDARTCSIICLKTITRPFGPNKYNGQPCTQKQMIAYCFVQTSRLATLVELTVLYSIVYIWRPRTCFWTPFWSVWKSAEPCWMPFGETFDSIRVAESALTKYMFFWLVFGGLCFVCLDFLAAGRESYVWNKSCILAATPGFQIA